MYKKNQSFLLLAILIISMAGCTVYVSPDSATIKRNTIPAAEPSYKTTPVAEPSYKNVPTTLPTTSTTTTKKMVITEIQDTPVVQAPKQSTATIKSIPAPKIIIQSTQTLYTVKPKDTVFSIMRKTNANWSDIIRINSLEPPNYTIYPGQVLRLK